MYENVNGDITEIIAYAFLDHSFRPAKLAGTTGRF